MQKTTQPTVFPFDDLAYYKSFFVPERGGSIVTIGELRTQQPLDLTRPLPRNAELERELNRSIGDGRAPNLTELRLSPNHVIPSTLSFAEVVERWRDEVPYPKANYAKIAASGTDILFMEVALPMALRGQTGCDTRLVGPFDDLDAAQAWIAAGVPESVLGTGHIGLHLKVLQPALLSIKARDLLSAVAGVYVPKRGQPIPHTVVCKTCYPVGDDVRRGPDTPSDDGTGFAVLIIAGRIHEDEHLLVGPFPTMAKAMGWAKAFADIDGLDPRTDVVYHVQAEPIFASYGDMEDPGMRDEYLSAADALELALLGGDHVIYFADGPDHGSIALAGPFREEDAEEFKRSYPFSGLPYSKIVKLADPESVIAQRRAGKLTLVRIIEDLAA